MVSSDEIRKKLDNKRKGIKTQEVFCPECGTKNPADSKFCLECGATLISEKKRPMVTEKSRVPPEDKPKFADTHPTLGKIPGFRSGTGWKMVVGSVGYLVIALIVVFAILFAVINTDVATSVNSAIYTDNVAGNQISQISSSTDKYLILDVSVKNKGSGKVTIDPSDFSILTGNEDADSEIFIGNTSIESVEIAPGETKNMVIAFTVPNDIKPDKLKYVSLWDMGSEGATANIGTVNNGTPFEGQFSSYSEKGQWSWSGGSKSIEKKINTSYNFLDQPFTIESNFISTFVNGSEFNTSKTYPKSIKETSVIQMISPTESSIYITSDIYITMPTGTTTEILSPDMRDAKGVYQANVILNPGLTSIGRNITIVDSDGNTVGSEKLIRSEVIDIMGKKMDCWVTETKSNSAGHELTLTSYYDKTTGLLLKVVTKDVLSGYGQTATYTSEQVLTATNVPLVGVKT